MKLNIKKPTLPTKDQCTAWLLRPQVYGFFISLVVMAIVSVAYFYPNNFNGDVLMQYDTVQGQANGAQTQQYEEATGQKALWTNALFSGMPTFQISPSYPSNSLYTWLNAVYGLALPAPSNLMFMMMFGFLIMGYCWRLRWWYALIGALAWGLSSYFIIIIGAGHIWKFVALSYLPPVIGALALAYRGRYLGGAAMLALFGMLQLNANHPQITYYGAFIVLALVIAWFVQALRRRALKQWCMATAVSLGAAILALGANLPSLYNTYEYAKETLRAGSELQAEAPAPAEGDAANEHTGGMKRSEIGSWSNMPSETATLLIPNLKGGASGRLTGGQMQPVLVADLDQGTTLQDNDVFGLYGQFRQYFGGKVEGTNGPFYLGAFICALFLLGCFIVRSPVKWALLAATALACLMALGNHFPAFTNALIDYLPMYNKFRAAETALVIAALCVPLLAMMALQQLFTTPDALQRYRKPMIASFGFCAALALLAWLWPEFYGQPFSAPEMEVFGQARDALAQEGNLELSERFEAFVAQVGALRLELVSSDGLRSLLMILCGTALVLLALSGKLRHAWAAMGIGLVVVMDLWGVDRRYVDQTSFVTDMAMYADPLAPDAIDKAISADKGYYRVADQDAFGHPARSAHHNMIGGYHAAKLRRYDDLITCGLLGVTRDPEQGVYENSPGVLDMLNTKYEIIGGQLLERPTALGPAWFVRNIEYVDSARTEIARTAMQDPASHAVAHKQFAQVLGTEQPDYTPGDNITLVSHTPDRLTYRAQSTRGGLAVFSEVYFPWGWQVTVDGQPATLGRVDYVLRALRLPPGEHTVVMTFDPPSLHTTQTIAYICVTITYLLIILALFMALCLNPVGAKGGETPCAGGENPGDDPKP